MNLTYLSAEIRRLVRNKRILIFSVAMPAILLLIFGGLNKGETLNGVGVAAYTMVSMGLFGSMSAAMGSGGSIAVERGLGWNRQLRLTPLSPGGYVLTKVFLSLLMAVPPLVVVYLIGAIGLDVRLPASTWALVGLGSWLGALPFAALGVVIGYVAKPDSVQQVSGLLYMLLAAFGGLWVPVEVMPHLMRSIAEFTPAYWVGQVARSPLFHGGLSMRAVAVMLAWAVGLGLVALRRFRADTARA
ncbi:MAG TPA: ABC transporter permease [Micromonosporaceae bacterium]|jgi:ABC-2 type transport system permease protein|nr:ABC transporter permease [Micromonosporaceae bacterium]